MSRTHTDCQQEKSPSLVQFNSGIAAHNVTCKQFLGLIFKAEDGSPACVRPDTFNILLERGFGQKHHNRLYHFRMLPQAEQNEASSTFFVPQSIISTSVCMLEKLLLFMPI
ncbi:MAG: hypothetical protein KGI02_08065 [Thaumarchaeota archaeon]|nr:hypothetical protein [Candidatus Nitrosotalea sp.]MDE1832306.1 hypothetical protein [Nitrososphaerota archaeon]MDE1873110.1 hypothetical protein [Nitrososphaerota archaeon]